MASFFGRLPGQAENFLSEFEPNIRVLSIFDPTQPPVDASSLVAEDQNSDSLSPRQGAGAAFLAGFRDEGRPVKADVLIAVTASSTHKRCSSYYTCDDATSDGVDFTFNNFAWRGDAYKNIQPGITALHVEADSVTALHEFSHAASS